MAPFLHCKRRLAVSANALAEKRREEPERVVELVYLKIPPKMRQIIIHIGLPRTGTTTCQKSLFKLARNTIVLSKTPYKASAKTDLNNRLIENQDPGESLYEGKFEKLYSEILLCSLKLSVNRSRADFQERLGEVSSKICKLAEHSQKQILFSTERLVDTTTSLKGDSIMQPNSENEFPIHPLCQALSENNTLQPSITTCMRDPIEYLRSKYMRTFFQRRSYRTLRDLTPMEFIQKQAILESNNPGASALTPAMHSEFMKQLQKHAFVKAYGFQELLASNDVFSLMGLSGEGKYAFRDFPRENKTSFTKDQEQEITIEIIHALKQYDFYDRVMKAKMFE